MPELRAKFRVSSVQETNNRETGEKEQEYVSIHAVYSSDPNSENAQWSKWTPAGSLSMTINNPGAFGILKANQEFYLDFTAVENEPQV